MQHRLFGFRKSEHRRKTLKQKNNVSKADKKVTIVDTVSYSNLKEGKKYTVKGTLMDQKTGRPIVDAKGQKITAEATFVAETSSGTVDVTFTFDGSNLQGETIVVFEKLYHGEKTSRCTYRFKR